MLTPKSGSACIPSSLDEESGSISAREENGATGEIVPTLPARETYTMIYRYRGLTLQRDRMYRSDQENRPEDVPSAPPQSGYFGDV